jgi:Tol biopolymer transport system component
MRILSGRSVVVVCTVLLCAPMAHAQTQSRVSVASGGIQSNGGSSSAAMTPDGRYVAFVSSATNLTAEASAGVFRHDRLGGTTTFIAPGSAPTISDDGQFVAFTSNVDNLVTNDANGLADIFIWSAATGTFQRVTPASGPQHLIQLGHLSGNAQFVAYSAQVGTASPQNIVFDAAAGTHVAIGSGGLHEPNYISADGRWVAYTQSSSSPLPNDTNDRRDVYLFDRQEGITTIASTTAGGAALGNADSEVSGLSSDGRYVLFSSAASNFPGTRAPGPNSVDLFLKDMQSGALVQVNLAGAGERVGPVIEPGPGFASPGLSANGRFVVFASTASNVGADTNGLQDTFLWDRNTAAIVRVSVPESGAESAGGRSRAGVVSNDGRYIAFESAAHNLVPGDTNFESDIFLRDSVGAPPCAVTLSPSGLAVVSSGGGNGTINVTASSSCAWTATVNAPWIRTIGVASGVGDGAFSYEFNPYCCNPIRSGAIVVNTAAYGLRQLGTPTQPPFGSWDTPSPIPTPGGGTSVSGAVAFTGWALDDVQVARIRLLRDPVAGEGPVQIYIGDAVKVAGARPDVAASNPSFPYNTQAGWGLLVLTNMLPNQGNGVFTFHVYFDDAEGHTTLAGSRTLTVANAASTEPFGTIDTPTQGQTVSGTIVNFGWALTPQPASIPADGSTINVFIDGVNVGHPSYGHSRSDIATLFPGYANSNGAVGHFTINTTAYADGVHTIAWVVIDNLGAATGIGSRYFTIQNGATPVTPPFARRDAPQASARSAQPILSVRGDEQRWVRPDAGGVYEVRVRDLNRIELRLDPWHGPASCGTFTAAALPAGASLDARSGLLAWQPAAGVGGAHDITVTRTSCGGTSEAIAVRVVFEKR